MPVNTRRARAPLLAALVAAAACALALVAAGGAAPATAAAGLQEAQSKLAGLVLRSTASLFRLMISVLPGVAVASVAYVGYNRRELTKRSGALLAALFFASLVFWAWYVKVSELPSGPPVGQAHATPHSGEAIVTKDGRHIVVADPTKPEGSPVEQGWQRNLATEMTEAIKNGREQVMLMFSRQGCPWCDRQLPVIHRAIESRRQEIEAAGGMAAGAAFVGGGGAGGMLHAPIRAFVLDAGEFPYLVQQFQIEAFPTNMFFGQPGAAPLVAQGFLKDEQLEEILHQAAVARPQEPAQGGRRGGGQRRKRRGLFR